VRNGPKRGVASEISRLATIDRRPYHLILRGNARANRFDSSVSVECTVCTNYVCGNPVSLNECGREGKTTHLEASISSKLFVDGDFGGEVIAVDDASYSS